MRIKVGVKEKVRGRKVGMSVRRRRKRGRQKQLYWVEDMRVL